MTAIEDKRKELEEDAHYLNDDVYAFKLDGFNLGVKMAREEVLDILNTRIRRQLNLNYNLQDMNNNGIIDFIIKDITQSFSIQEFKQSFGGEK